MLFTSGMIQTKIIMQHGTSGKCYFEYVDILIGVPGKEYVLASYSSDITW